MSHHGEVSWDPSKVNNREDALQRMKRPVQFNHRAVRGRVYSRVKHEEMFNRNKAESEDEELLKVLASTYFMKQKNKNKI